MGDGRGCLSSRGRGERRRLAGLATLILAAFLAPPVSAQQATSAASLVFDGVTVVDVEGGKRVPDQRVVITGNRIQAVGGAAVAVPKGARVVDAKGKYLIPGLWDMHTHAGGGPITADSLRRRGFQSKEYLFYPLFLANGVTGIRDAWSATPLDTLIKWRQEILAGTRVGPPRQLLGGASFGQHYESRDSAVVKRLVDSLKALGANFLKTYGYSPTVAAAARRAGLQFGGHVDGVSAAEVSDSGMSIIDHVNSAGGLDTICVMGPRISVERCQALAERFRRNGTWWVPTMAILPGMLTPYRDTATEQPRRLTKGQYIVDSVLVRISTRFWWDTTFASNWLHEGIPRGPGSTSDLPGLLHIAQLAGLPILAGTDVNTLVGGGVGDLLPGIALHAELAIYAAEGLTPLEALQTATLNPAKMLHGTDSLGTVAPGKLADLVLLDADPLADITNTTAIRAVVANGHYFDRATLDSIVKDAQAAGP